MGRTLRFDADRRGRVDITKMIIMSSGPPKKDSPFSGDATHTACLLEFRRQVRSGDEAFKNRLLIFIR
jgi:hypothetical protein